MNNSGSCQPNEWNHSDLADSPAENVNALKAWTEREVDPRPVNLSRTELARTREDETHQAIGAARLAETELARTREDETFNRWLIMSAKRETDLSRTPVDETAKLAFSSH